MLKGKKFNAFALLAPMIYWDDEYDDMSVTDDIV